jgi:hypothetical protein
VAPPGTAAFRRNSFVFVCGTWAAESVIPALVSGDHFWCLVFDGALKALGWFSRETRRYSCVSLLLAPDRLARRWGEPGKIVIDCTNPLGMGPDGLQLVLGFNTSAGEQVASWAQGAFVFKTLNTTGAGNMAKAADYPVKPVMLVAGDDAGRKPGVMELVGKLGFEPVDAGPLKNARLLEPFAMVWIDQALKRGHGRDFAFALVNMR